MAVTVRLPGTLRQWADGQKLIELDSATISEAIHSLCTQYPAIGERVLDDQGQLRRFVNVYLNGEDIRLLQGEATLLSDKDEVILAPAVAGGS
jgi:sulfur-carrier protein